MSSGGAVKKMNQILQFLILFGTVGVFFAVIYANVTSDMAAGSMSQRERVELFKTQTLEQIKLIEIVTADAPVAGSGSNTIADVINLGENDITISRLFVNGTESINRCTIDVRGAGTVVFAPDVVPAGKISHIRCEQHGSIITIVTSNDKVFEFGGT